MATIDCGDQKPLNEYTIVHELGHVFQHRTTQIVDPGNPQAHPCYSASTTTQSINGCMERPVPNAQNDSLGFGDAEFVMGVRSLYLTHTQVSSILQQFGIEEEELSADDFTYQAWFAPNDLTEYHRTPADWLRGVRGWGSAAPTIGPCDEATPPNFIPTNFQQNPCVFYKWLQIALGIDEEDPILTTLGTIEYEEALAEMFLNWVYWKNYGPPPLVPTGTPTPSGFGDIRWRYASLGGGAVILADAMIPMIQAKQGKRGWTIQ